MKVGLEPRNDGERPRTPGTRTPRTVGTVGTGTPENTRNDQVVIHMVGGLGDCENLDIGSCPYRNSTNAFPPVHHDTVYGDLAPPLTTHNKNAKLLAQRVREDGMPPSQVQACAGFVDDLADHTVGGGGHSDVHHADAQRSSGPPPDGRS